MTAGYHPAPDRVSDTIHPAPPMHSLPLTADGRPVGRWLAFLVVVLGLISLVLPARSQADEQVFVVEVSGTIDQGLAPYLQRIVDRAESEGGTVLLDIDTPGGRLDAALEMRRTLLDAEIPTVAFVDPDAFSAGALITIAAEQIHVVPGGVIGAATPVTGSGETADEKTISAVSGAFRATAEARGRDPVVAEAMVDPDVEIPGLVESGELLTLSEPEAVERGYADAVVADLDASLEAAGLADAEVVLTEPSPVESLVRFLTNPVVASLLLTVGIWLIIGDVLVGGVGFTALAGAALVAAFLWGHRLAGLAGFEDIALVVLGLVLIALEIFVIPGTGVAGILGLVSLLGGAYLAMLGREFATGEQVQTAVIVVSASFLLIVAGLAAGLAYLSRGGGPRGLVLVDRLGERSESTRGWLSWLGEKVGDDSAAEPATPHEDSLQGATGVALTDLRPSGMADIDGRRIDVVTEGGYVASGEQVEVIADHGYRRVVRAAPGDR